MLSTTDLLQIQKKPAQKDLALQTIQTFYKEHLCDRVFIYELDDEERPLIKLRFTEGNLCHLLGVQYILKSKHKGTSYVGESGYKLIEDGTVTFDFLKKSNAQWFKSKKNRMLYFPFVHQILLNPTAILFSTDGLNTNLKLDIILYNFMDNTYLHLGLDKDPDSDYFYPKSFYDRKKDDHIAGQKQLTITNKRVEIDN